MFDNAGMVEKKAGMDTVIRTLCERAEALAREANARGFRFFGCDLDSSKSSTPIRLQFADGTGMFFDHILGIRQISAKAGVRLNLKDSVDVKIAVQSRVLNMDGIESIRRGMKRHRLPAKSAPDPHS